MWVMLVTTGFFHLEQALSSWWLYFTYDFQEQWQFGEGIFLFVYEPFLILFSALAAQVIFRLKPKTIWSAPGLLLGTYMFFWVQPVIYSLVTGNDYWGAIWGYCSTMPWVVGTGQLLVVKHGFETDWKKAFWFALVMLVSNYIIVILWPLFLGSQYD
jgi:hypothetical protein